MPRFLNTHTGQFVWIADPKKCSYAILSHTWQPVSAGGEQSYEDLQRLHADVAAPLKTSTLGRSRPEGGQDSVLYHPGLSAKIKGICRIAREAGYNLVWIDSCCIDKSSSAELSEAINSMYEWYRLADICYAYLEDVPDGAPANSLSFSQSKWYTRGWTLQELIAPKHIIFLSSTWRFLGTKMSLAATLEMLTGVDFAILTGQTQLSSFSVARRMSWAARRQTTREEDEAYCLMGIFNIHMSPIYGEGREAAFTRLQEQIIKTIPDQSIFSWGRCCLLSNSDTARNLSSALQAHPDETGLLARAPADFEFAVDDVPLLPADFAVRIGMSEGELPPLHCTFTPQGVRVQVLCIDLSDIPQGSTALATLNDSDAPCSCRESRPACHSLALLQCENLSDGTLVALPMCHPILSAGEPAGLIVSTQSTCGRERHSAFRVVRLARAFLQDSGVRNSIALHEVFIRMSSAPPANQDPPPALDPAFSISFDPGCLEDLQTLGFSASPLRINGLPGQENVMLPQNPYEGFRLNVSAATTLSCGRRPFPQRPEQLIEVQIDLAIDYALRSIGPLAIPRLLGQYPAVHFSVRHFFDIVSTAKSDHDANTFESPLWDASNPWDGMREAPCAGAGAVSRLDVDLRGTADPVRRSTQVEFVIHVDAQKLSREAGDSAFEIRLLRVSLYPEHGSLREFGYGDLRLCVQLTEPYSYKRMLEAGRGTRIGHFVEDGDAVSQSEIVEEVTNLPSGPTSSRGSDYAMPTQHHTLESTSFEGSDVCSDTESGTSKLPSLPFYLMQLESVTSLLMKSDCSLSAYGWPTLRTSALHGSPFGPNFLRSHGRALRRATPALLRRVKTVLNSLTTRVTGKSLDPEAGLTVYIAPSAFGPARSTESQG
ncbi:hypothetical protein BC628DRAFT_1368623 [Trametes gibbosa]|nr:hypothetical protein BC628DRAFT_1368623 [Trametes gibbosa]